MRCREAFAQENPGAAAAELPARYRLSHAAFEGFCRVALSLYCPLSVFGRELLPPPPFLLCANHCSHMDTPALMTAAGGGFRKYAMIAARDYFFSGKAPNPLRYRRLMFLIPVDRQASRRSLRLMFSECAPHLKAGRSLIIYPEGTRSRGGEMGEMKRGGAVLSLELNLPVVPAYVCGTFRRLPKGAMFPRPGKISVQFGEPLHPSDFRDDKQASRALTNSLAEAIRKLREAKPQP